MNDPASTAGFAIGVAIIPLLLVQWVFCCYACSNLAIKKNYAGGWAFWAGFCFGPVAVLYYAGLPVCRKPLTKEQLAELRRPRMIPLGNPEQ